MMRFSSRTATTPHGVLITSYGLAYNEYVGDFVKVITLGDLLAE